MQQKHTDYKIVPNPKTRRVEAAGFRSVQHKPMIHGLIEVDVTRARAFLRDHKAKTGESLSFTAFLIACLAKAIDEHKAVHAICLGSKHLILFDEVDVYTLIERDLAGQKQPIPYIIRAANRKTLHEIHHEIRAAQVQDIGKVFPLPDFLFGPFFWAFCLLARRHPQLWKKYTGTVGITAVGMFGNGAGWGIPPALPVPMITVGGIAEKPGVVDGHIAIREHLSLTISFDHDTVDGAPAARFIERLKELIESAYGLDAPTIELEQAPLTPAARFIERLKELIESGHGLDASTIESEQAPITPAARFIERLKELIESAYGLDDPTIDLAQTPPTQEGNHVYHPKG